MSEIADPNQPETGTAVPAPTPQAEAQLEQLEQERLDLAVEQREPLAHGQRRDSLR